MLVAAARLLLLRSGSSGSATTTRVLRAFQRLTHARLQETNARVRSVQLLYVAEVMPPIAFRTKEHKVAEVMLDTMLWCVVVFLPRWRRGGGFDGG